MSIIVKTTEAELRRLEAEHGRSRQRHHGHSLRGCGVVSGDLRACLTVAVAICLLPVLLRAGTTDRTSDRVVSRFRIGPVFEYRATRDGGTFWAVRPLWSRLSDPVSDTRVTDVVWPVGTFHRDREQSWWRMALAYGSDTDETRDDAAWSAAFFPLYFQGRTRAGEDYRALFPIYGHLPHVLLMDDIDFFLFPLFLNYEVNQVERDYYLWPVFSRMGAESGVKRTGVFPLYGRTEKHDSSHLYAFWPFWNSAVYRGERNAGSSWMLFPLYGRVDREKEQQTLVVPPFFSHATTDAAERWRLPWPFIETATTPTSRKRSFWPLYGDVEREDELRWYAVWPLIERFNLKTKGGRTERSRFFPFYVGETVYKKDKGGREYESERYTRVWPFYASESSVSGTHLRTLELSLIRYSGGLERNWAPFWTLYERTEQGGEVAHDALWGLLQYRKAAAGPERSEP